MSLNDTIGDWFKTTARVRQGCVLSLTDFSIHLETVMTDVLEGHQGSVSTGGRKMTNMRFASHVDGLAGEER